MLELCSLRWPKIGLLQETEDGVLGISTSIIQEYYRFSAFSTSTEFYTFRAEHFLARKIEAGNEDWITYAWLAVQAVEKFVLPEWVHGPFPLYHFDFNCANILYDENYNITGLIDWSAVSAMPLESFLQPIDDVQRPMWEEDRKRFLDIFEEVEISINGTAPFARFNEVGCLLFLRRSSIVA